MSASAVQHIRKQHGDSAKEASRGQRVVTAQDVAAIPEVVRHYDAVLPSVAGENGVRETAFVKNVADGVLVYLARVSDKRSNLSAVSMWKFQPGVDPEQALEHAIKDKAPREAGPDGVPRPLSGYEPDAQTPPSSDDSTKDQSLNQGACGAFNPEQLTISLLKAADLSTFLHESAHFFFESDITLAGEILAAERRGEAITEGERQILQDVSTLLAWHGLQGDVREQLNQWSAMDFEERRAHHERTAESFEAYLFSGQAPNVELSGYFQRFRAWMLHTYTSLKAFIAGHPEAGAIPDEVRLVFDRMVATSEQIQAAEHGRSMMPLFAAAEQAGMSPEAWAQYQQLGAQHAGRGAAAAGAGAARSAMAGQGPGPGAGAAEEKAVGLRRDIEREVRRELLAEPVYRAWAFLSGKLQESGQLPAPPSPPAPRA